MVWMALVLATQETQGIRIHAVHWDQTRWSARKIKKKKLLLLFREAFCPRRRPRSGPIERHQTPTYLHYNTI